MTPVEGQRVGDNILVGELVIDVAGEIVAAVLGRAIDVLVLEVERQSSGVEAVPVVDANDAAIVGVESVGAKQSHSALLVTDVTPAVEPARCGEARVETGAQTEVRIGLEDDVDDAGHALGIILGRRIGHDFDALDDVGGNLLEVRGELRPLDRRRTAIDLDGDVLIAAQAHFAVGIDFHRGGSLQHIAGVRSRRRDVLCPIGVSIGLDDDRRLLAGDLHALQRHRYARKLYGAEVGERRRRSNGELRRVQRRKADSANSQVVSAGTKPLDAEASIRTAIGAGHELTVRFTSHANRGALYRGAATVGGDDGTAYLSGRLLRARWRTASRVLGGQ